MEELQAHHPADDQEQTEQPRKAGRLAESDHADERRSDSSDTDPDRVAGSDGNAAQRVAEARHAHHQPDSEDDGRHRPAEAGAPVERDGPNGFENTGNDDDYPGHDNLTDGGRLFRPGTTRNSSGMSASRHQLNLSDGRFCRCRLTAPTKR